MKELKEVAAYCAANIENWDIKCGMALSYIGKQRPIPTWFRNEIENCVAEWFSEHDVKPEDFDAKDVVLYESDD